MSSWHPDRLTIPVLAAAYRAPLGAVDLSLILIGDSGLGKSELAALAQQHYGAEMDRMHLPASFQSTANFNLGIAFAAKNALLVVDEFKPTGNRIDRQRPLRVSPEPARQPRRHRHQALSLALSLHTEEQVA